MPVGFRSVTELAMLDQTFQDSPHKSNPDMGHSRRAAAVGIIGAVGIITALVLLVGVDRVISTLLSADPMGVGLAVVFALCWLFTWSIMLRMVLATLDASISPIRGFFVYSGALFANNITPFGQAGGEPIAAALISKASDTRYETGLVSIASVDVINVVPSISLVLVGAGYYATTTAVGQEIETAVGSALVLLTAIAVLLVVIWRYRYQVINRLPGVIAPRLGRFGLTRLDAETLEVELADRIQRFFEDIERVATSPWRLSIIVGLSLTGWLFQTASLTAAFAALGYSVSPAILLFVIPLANVAGATPMPGGVGGIEAVFVTLLIPTTGIEAAAITAAVLLYRGIVYGLPVVIGGATMAAFGVRVIQ